VIKNNLKITELTEAIEAESDNLLVLNGSGTVGSKVLIVFNDNAFEATVDQTGKWFLQLAISDVATGDYVVTGQTQVGNEVSEEADLLTVQLTAIETDEVVVAPTNDNSRLYLYIGIATAVVVIGGLIAYYLVRKKKKASMDSSAQANNVVTTPKSIITPSEEITPTETDQTFTLPDDLKKAN
jgi:hypothetical protein